MTDQTIAEEVKSEIQNLKDALEDFQSSVRLTSIRDSVEDLGSSIQGLDQRIQSLREKGYAFEKELEDAAADFEKEWAGIAPNLETQIEKEASALGRSLRPLETQITQLAGESGSPAALQPRVKKLASQVETLEGRVESAEDHIRGMYDQFSSRVQEIKTHLGKLEWMMTELSEATFDLFASESGIMAVKAVWAKGGKQSKDDPEGVLFLTDQRLLFEQKEKVATKKVLFIATEKKQVQDLLWEVPIAQIEETRSYQEGFLNKDNYIEVRFNSKAPLNSAHLHIWQRGDDWVSLLKRAKAREFDATRAIAIDEEILETLKNAPTKCESCGGVINQPILRGMESITCEYCGSVIRL